MPGYVIHLTFAKLVEKKLEIKDSNSFLVGSLIPDACTCNYDKKKKVSHFDEKFEGLFKNPDLDKFLAKYGELINDEVVLGIYSHLYLDKHYYNEFMYENFEFSNKTMINKKTGKKFRIWEEFFARSGVYEQYTAMNKMFIEDYNLDVHTLNFVLDNLPSIPEYDYSKLKAFKGTVIGFVEQDGVYTGEYIEYEMIILFLEILATRFVNHINEIRK